MRDLNDTICARATPAGSGGIAIIRMSGRGAARILKEIFLPASGRLQPRVLCYGHVRDGEGDVDEAMAVLMPGPASYTREDVAEVHCHGSQALCAKILRLMTDRGARPAEPGEFTYRAFVNGRIDLAQAEAVMRMIRADSDRAMKSAVRQMEGGVSSFIKDARREIVGMLAGLSAAVDFPDEVDDRETRESLLGRCEELRARLLGSVSLKEGRLEEEGLRVALCGRPNAGKSSLLNALTGEDRAIVTAVPGTTRDVLTVRTQIGGLPVVLTDTAGLRETGDEVERIGVSRARRAVSEADIRAFVVDDSEPLGETDLDLAREIDPQLVILSKGDLPGAADEGALRRALPSADFCRISVRERDGLARLKEKIASYAKAMGSEDALLTQERHADACRRACLSLGDAVGALRAGYETDLAAIDLSAALDALGEITGETLNEQVISEVFSRFCVGK